jgi:hypothetical protein
VVGFSTRDCPALSGTEEIMARKQFFCIVDTETTIGDTVADFGAIIVDRKGKIFTQCAVLVRGEYGDKTLFHDKNKSNIWGYEGLRKREQAYIAMLESGKRMIASVSAINRWLNQAVGKYNPALTAYNLTFDIGKCANTGIDLDIFTDRFCLWQASVGNICTSKKYRQFCMENHLFNAPTEKRNMTYKTTAESVCGFVRGEFIVEPHTALEDARDFELPILQYILKRKGWRNNIKAHAWQDFQVKDHFCAV